MFSANQTPHVSTYVLTLTRYSVMQESKVEFQGHTIIVLLKWGFLHFKSYYEVYIPFVVKKILFLFSLVSTIG